MINRIYSALKRDPHFFRFIAAGVFNTIVGYFTGLILFYFLTEKLSYEVILVIIYIVSTVRNFVIYKLFVFKTKNKSYSEFFKINILYLFLFLVKYICMYIFVDLLSIGELMSYSLAFGVMLFFSFFGQRFFVFNSNKK